jgi:CRP-like cAMP-binding protein
VKEFPFNPDDRSTLDRLRRMPVFDAMDPARLPSLLGVARVRGYDEGEVIMAEGDVDQMVYFLIRGRCSVNVDGMDLGFIETLGDVFGEMGMVDQKPRSATITAETPVLCLALDNTFLERMKGVDKLAAEALFYRIFSEILAARIRDANARILTLEDELEDLSVQRPTF